MKKILDSDWLRAVQFKCNTGEKSETPVQVTHGNLDYDWLKNNGKFSKPMTASKKGFYRKIFWFFLHQATVKDVKILKVNGTL